jgi:biopolymer transport protein ExbD
MQIKKFDSINVVPFIDIMLVLLVIVLTTASFVAKGLIPVDLSKAQNADNYKPQKELTITLDSNNHIFIDKKEIAKEAFEDEILQFNPTKPIIINADRQIAFEEFVYILDILKKLEFSNIGIITKNE